MALKDKPHAEYHQDPFLRWLSHWYEKPQGRRVRERLLQRIRQHAAPGPGEVAIELSPVPMLEESDTLGGPIVRMDSSRPGLLMEPEFWPLESDCARRIVLAHPCAYSDLPAAVVAEAARVGMYEYDRGTAFIHLEDAQAVFQTGENVTGLRLRLTDMMRAGVISREVASELDGLFRVSDWTRQHANLFRAIQIEKMVMFIILSLIVAVAAFNIVSTLIMLVTDKQGDIAILRTLGLSPSGVMAVFVVQGVVIGAIGILLGSIAGVALALNIDVVVPFIERAMGIEFLAADVYYISDLPSELKASDVFRVGGLAFLLTVVATLFPAWRAARTQPAEALRHD